MLGTSVEGAKDRPDCAGRGAEPAELEQAIAGGAESILLDNMTPAMVKKAVKQIRHGASGRSD